MFPKTGYVAGALDFALVTLIGVLVGLFVVAHVTLVMGLLRRQPRWHGIVALVVPPLAPYWGYEAKLRRRVTLWVVTVAFYLLCLALARL